jgi:hypothetical protein
MGVPDTAIQELGLGDVQQEHNAGRRGGHVRQIALPVDGQVVLHVRQGKTLVG